MRTLCDACESAAAIVFCAADEAALCHACDEKVHMCNKLASRHVRVGLISPSEVPTCDICETAHAFFYCETDGSSLCLQCDIMVHIGGKRKHVRHLLFRQKIQVLKTGLRLQSGSRHDDFLCLCNYNEAAIEVASVAFPGDKPAHEENPVSLPKINGGEKQQNHRNPLVLWPNPNDDGQVMKEANMFDLNMKPHRIHEHKQQ